MTDEEHEMSHTPTVRAHANLRLPHSDRAPRLARAFVAENLQGWQLDGMVETASLVVSEVVTNAVVHARSDAELLLERTPTALRISVIDHGEGLSQREKTGVGDGGRGLLIVEALSSRWGTEPTDGGNCVWAELTIEPA
jgi:anti-sigma regulatory factor (Ser/Thr protein kinase)